ncbi:hypothetical protein KAZ93_04090 [Patescibacteria group bacterium]|nr:hypothetical protein [Patescibacteria group bacterium]
MSKTRLDESFVLTSSVTQVDVTGLREKISVYTSTRSTDERIWTGRIGSQKKNV